MYIYLANGGAGQLASIFDVESDHHFAVSIGCQLEVAAYQLMSVGAGRDKPELERGVTATEPEWERALGSTGCVKPPVPDIEAFGVDGSNCIAELDMLVVVERHRPCDGELPTRIAFAKDGAGDGGTTFVPTKKRLK